MKELDEFLMETVEEEPIFDLEDATNQMAKINFLQGKIDEVDKVAKAYINKINAWKESQTRELKGKKEYFENSVIDYYNAEKSRNEKFKLSTPFGKVSQRKTSKWLYGDEGKVVRQLKVLGHNELIRTKEEIDKNALKQKFKVDEGRVIDPETGEVLEDVKVEDSVSASVKLADKVIAHEL